MPNANILMLADGEYGGAAAITPHDANNLTRPCRAIWVGATGNISLVTAQGDTVTLNSVPVGLLRVGAIRVNATSTTATNLVALY